MSSVLNVPISARRVAVAVVIGLAASVGLAATPASAYPAECTQNYSEWYCYYNATSRGGDEWSHYSCWDGNRRSYPSWLRDHVRSWDHRQTNGAWISNWNYLGSNVWQWVFDMYGQAYKSNQPSNKADALRNEDCF